MYWIRLHLQDPVYLLHMSHASSPHLRWHVFMVNHMGSFELGRNVRAMASTAAL